MGVDPGPPGIRSQQMSPGSCVGCDSSVYLRGEGRVVKTQDDDIRKPLLGALCNRVRLIPGTPGESLQPRRLRLLPGDAGSRLGRAGRGWLLRASPQARPASLERMRPSCGHLGRIWKRPVSQARATCPSGRSPGWSQDNPGLEPSVSTSLRKSLHLSGPVSPSAGWRRGPHRRRGGQGYESALQGPAAMVAAWAQESAFPGPPQRREVLPIHRHDLDPVPREDGTRSY